VAFKRSQAKHSPAKQSGAPRPVTAMSLENVAMHYIERFASSAADLRRVLLRRVRRAAAGAAGDDDRTAAAARLADGAALVEALIAKLQSAGILDDRRYAETKAASLHRRGGSRRAVAARLAQHGVERDLITAAIETLGARLSDAGGDTADLVAAAAFIRRRRLGPYRNGEFTAAARLKDMAALARAGFDGDTARRILACRATSDVEALLAASEEDG
jgi:regulatory protein